MSQALGITWHPRASLKLRSELPGSQSKKGPRRSSDTGGHWGPRGPGSGCSSAADLL